MATEKEWQNYYLKVIGRDELMSEELSLNEFLDIVDLAHLRIQDEVLIHGTIKVGNLKKRFDEIFEEIRKENE